MDGYFRRVIERTLEAGPETVGPVLTPDTIPSPLQSPKEQPPRLVSRRSQSKLVGAEVLQGQGIPDPLRRPRAGVIRAEKPAGSEYPKASDTVATSTAEQAETSSPSTTIQQGSPVSKPLPPHEKIETPPLPQEEAAKEMAPGANKSDLAKKWVVRDDEIEVAHSEKPPLLPPPETAENLTPNADEANRPQQRAVRKNEIGIIPPDKRPAQQESGPSTQTDNPKPPALNIPGPAQPQAAAVKPLSLDVQPKVPEVTGVSTFPHASDSVAPETASSPPNSARLLPAQISPISDYKEVKPSGQEPRAETVSTKGTAKVEYPQTQTSEPVSALTKYPKADPLTRKEPEIRYQGRPEESRETVVTVNIGRIEVRAVTSSTPAKPPVFSPPL